jgi:hypothetical protein
LEAVLFIFFDGEQFVELGDLKHFVDLRVNAAQNQLTAGGLDLAVERDQFTERGAGKELDILEV